MIRLFDSQKEMDRNSLRGSFACWEKWSVERSEATTYHLRGAHKQKVLQGFGATIVNSPIVVDDNIITFIVLKHHTGLHCFY